MSDRSQPRDENCRVIFRGTISKKFAFSIRGAFLASGVSNWAKMSLGSRVLKSGAGMNTFEVQGE